MSFDRLAPHYDWLEAIGAGHLMQRARTHWLDELAGCQSVLSVGEGHGRFAAAFVRRFPETPLTCVDASAPMLARARRRVARAAATAPTDQTASAAATTAGISRTTWIQAQLPEWQPPAGQFDAIVTCFALDCMTPAQLDVAIPTLAASTTAHARWLHVDFSDFSDFADFAGRARGLARLRVQTIEWALYRFFRLTAAIPARELASVAPLLTASGFRRDKQQAFSMGLIRAELWRRLTVIVAIVTLASLARTNAAMAQNVLDGPEHVHAASSATSLPGHEHTADIDLMPGRDNSGTSWQPEVVQTPRRHLTVGGWMLMLQGQLFAQFTYEPGNRHRTGGASTHQASGTGWGMVMARRPLGAGRVGIRSMLSVDPLLVGNCGYLNLLATGEVCEGDTIHDRQHPHDLIMELAADYDRRLRGELHLQVYGGLVGEPALGPTAFLHRASALANPVAPIGHHWLDATHVSFGVITTGLYNSWWKLEASAFNGREPDERRFGLDLGRLDSFAGRVTLMPSRGLVVQVSAGHLTAAEAGLGTQPRNDIDRTTASATHHRRIGTATWATTIAYGANRGALRLADRAPVATSHGGLLESTVIHARSTWFGRAELVGKPAHDLHAHEYGADIFGVARLQAGYAHALPAAWHAEAGASVSANLVPAALASRYGGRLAPGVTIFLRATPFSPVPATSH